MELKEILNISNPKILHEGKTKDGNTMTILAPFTQADQKNKNGRTYPQSLLKREVERVQKAVEAGTFIGSGDHNATGQSTISDASHIIKKLWIDESGKGWCELKIVPTPKGNSVMTLIHQGAALGLSTRGNGTVSPSGIVQNDFKLSGVDIVTNPSVSSAIFDKSNIFESADFETKIDQEIQRESRRVTPSDVMWEAKAAGVSPVEFAEKINAAIDREEESIDSGFSKKEHQQICAEAQRAGMDMNDPEQRKRALQAYDPEPNDEDSKLEAEAIILGKKLDVTLEAARNMLLKEREIKRAEKLKAGKIDFLVKETLLAGAVITKKEK